MKIERIDEQTIKCFISNQELEQYGISYKDFIMRNDKAREIMEKIMRKASDQVGYQAPGMALDLQIMMLPEQGMLLTLSEKTTAEERKVVKEKQQGPEQERKAPEYGIFAFDDLDSIMGLAAILPGTLRVESVLYKLGELYYLELSRSRASLEKFKAVCARAMEFGRLSPSGEAQMAYLREHGSVMIASRALRKLGGIKKN